VIQNLGLVLGLYPSQATNERWVIWWVEKIEWLKPQYW
jgi:hypothetical protein